MLFKVMELFSFTGYTDFLKIGYTDYSKSEINCCLGIISQKNSENESCLF